MPPKDPSNTTLIIDNKDMEKPKDQTQKPSDNSVPPHKVVPFVPQEIWERILKEEQEKERKNAGPAVLWPMND